ncbi:Probable RNA-directed DNA polymerase from transposon X-element [Eumeta japonica]|uniref:Probable RNA-directed DNA polymerase from transposon X-element n=1 Tax=Eumeta variegata TaxID=151549 RepID=A0A4C1YT83_EUMVA|nr:Probable RNA-directed DNA polymerase from transposon X-element [Eumeta japonica]
MGVPDGGKPIPIRKITNWKRVSTALEKIDTPNLNSIPNDIASTNEIDFAIDALTNHFRTVVEESERGSGILGSPEVSARYFRIDKSKKRSFAPRERISHSRVQIQSASSPTQMAIDDVEIAKCLADSIETQCSHASSPHDIAHISRIEEEVLQKTSLEPKDDLAPVLLSEVQTLVKSLNIRKAPGLYGIHKPGKPRDLPASYRPISLLSGLGKIFEKILKTRLNDHLLGKGLSC